MRLRTRLLLGPLACALMCFGAAQGIALASTFTGCLTEGGAVIHVAIGIEPASPCNGSQTQIGWSETGPVGPQGPQGPAGPGGSSGVSGWEIHIDYGESNSSGSQNQLHALPARPSRRRRRRGEYLSL